MKLTRLTLIISLFFTVQACAQSATPAANASAKPSTGKNAVAMDFPEIRAAILKLAPTIKINAIRPSVLPGFKEVVIDGKVLYVSNDGKLLIQGALIDTATRRNLTEVSEAANRKGLLQAIPDDHKIIFAPAKPKYTVTVFTDIDCGFCRKMHSQIAEYNKLGIAVEYLFFPRAGINSEAYQKAVNVWCAPNRNTALTLAKNDKSLPKKTCTNYVTADYKLGMQVGVDGTPAVYAANGMAIGGYLSPQDMLKALQGQNN
ncbi:MAG: thioredoxin fold domain-containing protein [Arenimonas sp.]|nr:thioredoxin fold domain-containing protein [Arenimonas sp.]